MSNEKGSEIVPVVVEPLVTTEKAVELWHKFEDLKAKLLTDDDYQVIAGKRFIKRSGFRKIGVVFGLSDRILKEERVDRPDGSFVWRIVVEVLAPNGRTSIGVGACDSRERKFAHLEHDVLSTAHTRAKSRGISDMVAGGVVSAEEAEGEVEAKPKPSTAEGTRSAEEPAPPARLPEKEKKTWEPKVLVVKEVASEPGLRQFPLVQGTLAVGMVNLLEDGSEASIVPEKPVPVDDPAVRGFLVRKVLDAMEDVEYSVIEEQGLLIAVLLRGQLGDARAKELANAARWAFSKAMERVSTEEAGK